MHSIWRKTLIALLILVFFGTVQNINTPFTNRIIEGVKMALHLELDYAAWGQSVDFFWDLTQIRLKNREEAQKNIFPPPSEDPR